jgi:hypothetical protein
MPCYPAKDIRGVTLPAGRGPHAEAPCGREEVQAMLAAGRRMKVVTTPMAFPGAFQDDIDQPMLDFLEQTGSYLMVNIYPYSRT